MDQIKAIEPWNIGLLAHVDAGKTTLTEQMLYISGSIKKIGRVDEGNAHTDFMEIEKRRGISVRAASAYLLWKGQPVNIIDTPGHSDFSSEVQRSIRAMDAAVIVVSAVEGVQPQTEVLWEALRSSGVPVMFFINKRDREGSDVRSVIKEIEDSFVAVLIPSFTKEKESITEVLCGVNDDLLEKYVEQGPGSISEEELLESYESSFSQRKVFPFVAGAALIGEGVEEFLDLIELLAHKKKIVDRGSGLSAVIFKMKHDPQMGRVAYARLFSGSIKNRDLIYNASNHSYDKAVQIKKVTGAKEIDTGEASAGEIAAIYGLSNSRNGDVLGSYSNIRDEINIACPSMRVRVIPRSEKDYPALLEAVDQISAEDPLIDVIWEQSTGELILSVSGRLQIEVIEALLKERSSIDAVIGSPQVIYKERPSRKGSGYVEYTMPKPCWAVLRFEIEPLKTGSGVVFESRVRNEKIYTKYQLQVEQTIPVALRQGPKGWQVTDLKITLVDGEHHVVHTHPMDFIMATPIGIMDALTNAGTDLMEPINRFRITYPEEKSGKVIGEIIGMRGTFNSPLIRKGTAVMEGRYPVAEGIDFPARFSSITGGRGTINTFFDGYDLCPPGVGLEVPFRGISPADREKYILHKRGAVL